MAAAAKADEVAEKMKERFRTLGDSAAKKKKSLAMAMHGKRSNSAAEAIGKEGERIEFTAEELSRPAIVRRDRDRGEEFEEATRFPTDPLVDDEVLEQVEAVYYSEDFDPSEHELRKLPAEASALEQTAIDADRRRLKAQHLVVTKRVFGQILSAQSACQKEMERVQEIRGQLEGSMQVMSTQSISRHRRMYVYVHVWRHHDLFQVCRSGRLGLGQASQEFTASSLGILSAFRRRQQARKLLNDLSIIRTLVRPRWVGCGSPSVNLVICVVCGFGTNRRSD